jgi:hypothetical protein
MRIVKAILKVVIVVFLILIAAFVFVANFASTESVYACSGVIKTRDTTQQTTLFIKLTRYRWWVLWGNSDGMLHYEIPNVTIGLYTHLKSVGDYIQIYRDPAMLPRGQFSTISDSLQLNLTDEDSFSGTCPPKNK